MLAKILIFIKNNDQRSFSENFITVTLYGEEHGGNEVNV